MSKFLSSRFADLKSYTPGEQPQNMQYVKLNTNESPFPPPPQVLAAVSEAEVSKLNLYPDPDCRELRRKIAELYGVKTENIFLSNGSDDILNFFFMAFCDENRPVVFPDITYGFYQVYADLYRLPRTVIPLREDFTLNYRDYCGVGANVVIANPNATTGISIPVSQIEEVLQSNPDYAVLVDEAYVDFGGESCYRLIDRYDNLVVCRTFSKSWSMAGARLGYAIGSAGLIEDLNKIKFSTNPYSINRLTLAAGSAAVDTYDYFRQNCSVIAENRAFTVAELEKLGFETLPSNANFILTRHPDWAGRDLYEGLKSRCVLVRRWDQARIKDHLRVTIGSRTQMEAFLAALNDILKGE
jgi:histidinol-phosphate aminotransferase